MPKTKTSRDDYTVAWICPLEVEQVAAMVMLDEEHEKLPQPQNDHNIYTLGRINGHNVVIAALPSAGNNPAATVVTQIRNTFRQLRFGLLVGIGGGVPTTTSEGPIRVGHVVVSKPVGEHSGAVQYDHGKAETGGFRRTGFIAPPPTVLLNAAQQMAAMRRRAREDPLISHLKRIDTTIQGMKRYKCPGPERDHLYRAGYVHSNPKLSCQKCGCDESQRIDQRIEDSDEEDQFLHDYSQQVVVHRGTIASGELVMKDGELRDRLAAEYDILSFETEAAGALADFPCLVVRGIADYSDSHKNDGWQGYAAGVAAAYARQLFFHMPVDEVKQCQIAEIDIKKIVVKMEELAKTGLKKEIQKWLHPPDPSIDLNISLEKRHEDSNQWFLESKKYAKWTRSAYSRLWLHGIPGCGKTVLVSSIIEGLQGRADTGRLKSTLIYFYFDFADNTKQSLENMSRSFIFQLSKDMEGAGKHLIASFGDHEDGKKQPTTRKLLELLRVMMAGFDDITIVLDALDECDTLKDLLSWLKDIANTRSTFTNLHILMTSRQEEEIESSLEKWMAAEDMVSMLETSVNEDIRAFVQSRVRTDTSLERWRSRPDVQTLIERKLMEKANGMFRWAACQLDALESCLTLSSLQHTLKLCRNLSTRHILAY